MAKELKLSFLYLGPKACFSCSPRSPVAGLPWPALSFSIPRGLLGISSPVRPEQQPTSPSAAARSRLQLPLAQCTGPGRNQSTAVAQFSGSSARAHPLSGLLALAHARSH